ncbi:Protein phosphatase 2C 1 [Apophysomyces ossiformis]|uniref:Protein phosphatase 2C 1 n=1 Tax=Apophysomyces ossiformis TaxID=679940 RepID=A0A8H7BYE9_9FUNG|nr:Protein phosphatase 2C 1 [Apophysomyces ossiformis]
MNTCVRFSSDGAEGFAIGIAEDRNKRFRRTMEDSHLYVMNFDSVPQQGLFAIFDGHGGRDAAEWCGDHFHEAFLECYKAYQDTHTVPEILEKTFLHVDELIKDEEGKVSGCTAIVAFIQVKDSKRILYTANAGDARAVLSRNGKALRLSYDHKGSDAKEAKRIKDTGGLIMNNRVGGLLAVTRSLGDYPLKEYVIGMPYTTETELGPKDKFLILACDGLWDVCEDQTAVKEIKKVENPLTASKKLLDLAISRGTQDNVSVMVVRFT